MKKSLLLPLAFLAGISLSAQDIAMDWTRTECGTSIEHHLFSELDSGNVVILELVMINCVFCVEAGNSLKAIYDEYNQSHPGKVRLYSVGFNNFTTCPLMIDWKQINGYKHPVFEKGTAETNYYGGMGMPTIVVVGGSEHKVYYKNLGYAPSEVPPMKAAIDQALSESTTGSILESNSPEFIVFPNPFDDALGVQLYKMQATHLSLTDLSGKVFLQKKIETTGKDTRLTIPTTELPAGVWFVAIFDGERQVALQKVVKK